MGLRCGCFHCRAIRLTGGSLTPPWSRSCTDEQAQYLFRYFPQCKQIEYWYKCWRPTDHVAVPNPLLNCNATKCNCEQIEYWYKCWHPIDHVAVIPFPGISADNPKLPAIFVRVWEHYRKLPNETVPEFEVRGSLH